MAMGTLETVSPRHYMKDIATKVRLAMCSVRAQPKI